MSIKISELENMSIHQIIDRLDLPPSFLKDLEKFSESIDEFETISKSTLDKLIYARHPLFDLPKEEK